MKKLLKKYGDSLVISFSKEEKRIWKLEEGDVINVEITKPINWDAVKTIVKDQDKNTKENKEQNGA